MASIKEDEDPVKREAYANLNPASTSSSLQRIDRASIEEPIDMNPPTLDNVDHSHHVASDEIKIRQNDE